MHEARFYTPEKEQAVRCHLCAHRCLIRLEKTGICGVRRNHEGRLESLVYGKLIATHVDPIEKKPLFHFLPGSLSYSIATVGCNFRCLFCQNADISQAPRDQGAVFGRDFSPHAVVQDALKTRCATVSYTYTEPTIFMEFAMDVGIEARKAGLKNVFVSNGYMTPEAMQKAAETFLDAANVDLKAFRDRFYKEMCGARLEPVLETLRGMKRLGIWLEVTTLLIPGLNDDPQELKELAEFLVSLGPETPWHVSRFHPTYRLTDRPPTPVATLRQAREIGLKAGLHYVYTGNVPGDEGENTYCPQCGAVIFKRHGFSTKPQGILRGICEACGARIHGVDLP
ncbi:MAG: AmmeMemoRadiSam system radical SAM enzyme [Desulfosoma sp.]|uniref:AmmeMemoRadiSam system radical SAM enzyme n=1 Tax=Desulfosoma sp. TaxID=2603217 RepID=UPI00404A41BC